MKKNISKNKGDIVIYKPKGKEVEIRVKLKKETIWLNAHQIAQIFNIDRTVVVKHIQNIYKNNELFAKSTCAKIAQVAADGRIRRMNQYNLDMIISVGYRVDSKQATQFRVWATRILKQHILQGYTINQKRLLETQTKFKELQNAITFLQKKSRKKLLKGQEKEILDLLGEYSKTLSILEQYDKRKIKKAKGQKGKFVLSYDSCKDIIIKIKENLMTKKEASNFFGIEVEKKFESAIENLRQTFAKKELYRTIEEKAAHLLYLTIKDHPFIDGNKRIASFLFIYFLDKNDYLYRKNGEKKINDNALVALALLIAESNPKEKDILIGIVTNLISKNI